MNRLHKMSEISICFCRKSCEASSSISLTRMDSLPDGVVQYILSKLCNAKDVASCICVSKKWKDLMSYHKRLCFPYGIFDNLTGPQTPDYIVMQMVSSVSQLEELVVACPFTTAGLASWLLVTGSSLKNLELCALEMQMPRPLRDYIRSSDEWLTKLECIQAARNLESLRVWRVCMVRSPKWDVFHKLRNLEISTVTLEDSVLREALRATPNLTRLVLGDCKGLTTIWIDELLELRHCQLDVFFGWSLTLKAPKIEYLEVKGCKWITVHDTNCLKTLSICDNFQDLSMVDLGGNLLALESLCVEGCNWRCDVITKMLQLATHVKHLRVEILFINDFQEIDFVDLFKTHPKLKSFHVLGKIFDALCNNHTTLKNVDPDLVIPCLEEVVIDVKSTSPLDAKKMTRMVESLLKYGNKLKSIKVNTREIDFSEEILRMFRDPTTECHVIHRMRDEISICFRRKTFEASSSSISLTRMDSLPDSVVQYILSKLSNAKDVASCNCVSMKWKELMSYHKRLCFPHGIFNNLNLTRDDCNTVMQQMVSSVSQLEELVVACPFTTADLASWLLVTGSSLKSLELRVNHVTNTWMTRKDIRSARNLEYLRHWHVVMGVFHKLRNLEICGAMLDDMVLREALRATPNLTQLVLDGCYGLSIIWIELLDLQHCKLNIHFCSDGCSITLRAPKIQYLEVIGCNWIRVYGTNFLKTLSIHNNLAADAMVDLGVDNLMALEALCVGGDPWPWDVITKMLRLATQVKHLCLENGFTPTRFPEIDFVDFFKTHPKLEFITINRDMFDTLTTLKNVDPSFVIPCLEEVVITLKWPRLSNAKKVTRVIESLLKYGNKLKKININFKAPERDAIADAFAEEIHRLFKDSTTECRVIREKCADWLL